MKCKRAKQAMALSVGRDLDDGSDRELQRHISSCPPCRDYFGRLRASTSVLQQAGEESCEPLSDDVTLWPAVSRAIQKPARKPSPFTWSQAWVPAVAIASMVLAIVSISNTMNDPRPDGNILVGPGGTGADAANVAEDFGSGSRLIRQPAPPKTDLRDRRD
ncbi:MAG TPA: zf-HC2 domain-containing protein [Planctomycetaceae bacterium]|nr:zf-HC2 domain-containing protein [Planctomycetaceae bacterium]